MTVDCMTCLVNLARGLENALDISRITHRGVTHAAVYEMGPGRLRAACLYERVSGTRNGWRSRRTT